MSNSSEAPENTVKNSNNEQKTGRTPGLLRSSGIVSVMTMLSRVLGLVRDVTFANLFGAGSGADAFFVAFKIPSFFRRLFAEGAFNQAFVPILTEYKTKKDHLAVKMLIANTAGSLAGVLSVVTLIVVFASSYVVYIFAPGFASLPAKMTLAGDMLQITFPYLLLVSLTAFSGSVLNSYGRFAVPAFTPVILNLVLIACAFLLSPLFEQPIMALAWGVLLAGGVQLLFQFPFLKQLDFTPMPRWGWNTEGVVRIRTLMIPALFGVSVGQINLLLDTILASFLEDGSVSWLYYSDRLMELPLGVFGIAIATVILPSLSTKHAEKSTDSFSETLNWAVRMVLFIGVPSALALGVLAEPLLVTLFQYGEFGASDVDKAALSLRAYAAGLLGFMLIKVLAPGYFARQDTKTPVKIGIAAMVANMVFNLMLIIPLAHAGLALATSMSALLNAGLLLNGLVRSGVFKFHRGWGRFGLQLILGNSALLVALVALNQPLEQWLAWSVTSRVGWVALIVVSGMAVYFLALGLAGMRLRHLKHI